MRLIKNYFIVMLCVLMLIASANLYVSATPETITDTVSASVWDGVYPDTDQETAFSGGDGSEADPYMLSSATDVALLANNVDAGTDYAGKYFRLTCDLDMNNKEWHGIGGGKNDNTVYAFKGCFDGENHVIYNLKLEDIKYNGFFGHVGDGAVIKNIGIASGNIAYTNTRRSAALIGFVKGSCTVENCFNRADISFVYDSSAVDQNNAKPECRVGALIGTSMSGSDNTDGIKVIGCYNTGNIEITVTCALENTVGGILGYAGISGGGTTITDCYSSGNITVTTDRSSNSNIHDESIGGILGVNAWSTTNINNCKYSGDIDVVYTASGYTAYSGAVVGGQRANKLTISGGEYFCNIEQAYGKANSASDVSSTAVKVSSAIPLALTYRYFMSAGEEIPFANNGYQTGAGKIRFVSELCGDVGDYMEAGIEVEISYGGKKVIKVLRSDSVYTSLLEGSTPAYPASGAYFVACGITDVPVGEEITFVFTPFAIPTASNADICYGAASSTTVIIPVQ